MTTIVVTAAVIEREGQFLVTRRPEGTHLAGMWEFPGGKCHEGEALRLCLTREVREELGVECTVGEEVFAITHQYPERHVELHFFSCRLHGEPLALLGQEMRWVARDRLAELEFPPADAELIQLLASEAGPISRRHDDTNEF